MSIQSTPATRIPGAALRHNASCATPAPVQVFEWLRPVQILCGSCGYPQHCAEPTAAGACGTHAIAFIDDAGFRCAQHGGLIECPSCSFPTAPADGQCPQCGHVENDKATRD